MDQQTSTRRRRRNDRRGANTVEMAFALPILLMFVFAGFEFSRANLIRNMASNAAYEGARNAIVAGASATDAQTTAANVMNTIGVTNATVTVTPAAITPLTSSVKVEVSVPFGTVIGFTDQFLAGVQLEGECELTREGF